jgi:GAF domain-containing protein
MVTASGPASEVIEQLQFTLGEGPCHDAYALGRPVLTPDLSETPRSRWPGYASAAQDKGVRAVFAFPLQIGAARLGVLDVYRDRTGSLSATCLVQAMAFAEAAVTALLVAQEQSGEDRKNALDDAPSSGFEVYQAQGMVQVQLGMSLSEALARLRAHAYAHNRPLNDVARDVLAREISFEEDS